MTTFAEVTNAARTSFGSLVAAPLGITFAWDNWEFTRPDPDSTEPRWCRVAVRYDETRHAATGASNLFEKNGNVVVGIRAPIGDRDQSSLEVADAIKTAFRDLTASSVIYGVPSVTKAPEPGKTWWRSELSIPFVSRVTVAATVPTAGTTGFGDVGATIRSRFKTNVADPQGITVIWDNADVATPSDQVWVRFATSFGRAKLAYLGADYRTTGVAFAMIFAPVDSGDRESLNLADAIDAQFRAVTDAGVTFKAPTPRVIGRSGDLWQTNVVCPFTYDEVVV